MEQPDIIDNMANTYVDESRVHGRGLFASREMPAGTVLGVLDGQVMDWEQYDRLRSTVTGCYPALFFEWNCISPNTLLVRPFRTKYSFINHSREPNVALVRFPLRVVAIKDLAPGDELLLDYRTEPLPERYLEGHGSTYL